MAIRLPKEFGFMPGDELAVTTHSRAVILCPVDGHGWPVGYFDSWQPVQLPQSEKGL